MNDYLLSVSDGRGAWIQVLLDGTTCLPQVNTLLVPLLHLEDKRHDWLFSLPSDAVYAEKTYALMNDYEDGTDVTLRKLGLKTNQKFLYRNDTDRQYDYSCTVKEIRPHKQGVVYGLVKSHGTSVPLVGSILPEHWQTEVLADAYMAFRDPDAFSKISTLLAALSNLYGRMPLREAYKLYPDYYGELDKKTFVDACEILRHAKDLDFTISELADLFTEEKPVTDPLYREAVSNLILEDDDNPVECYTLLVERQGEKELILPDDLLVYSDSSFIEPSKAFEDLLSAIKRNGTYDCESTPLILSEFQNEVRIGEEPLSDLEGQLLEKFGLDKEARKLVHAWSLTLRPWAERGKTLSQVLPSR